MDTCMGQYKRQVKDQIEHLIDSGNLNNALILIDEYERIVKDDIELYSMKAIICIMEDKLDEAEEILNEGLKIDNESFDLNYNLGYVYFIESKYDEAFIYYSKAKETCKDETIIREIESKINEICSINTNSSKRMGQNWNFEIVKEDNESCLLLTDDHAENNIKNVLYLGWLGKGNVGDEALFELFKSMFYKYYKPICKDTVANIDAYPLVQNYKVDISAYDLIVLGGGSLIILPFWLKICEDAIKHKVPVVSWGTGMDGLFKQEHINLIKLSEQSLNQFGPIYEQFDYISVRGPFTRNLLINSGIKKKIYEIGDPVLFYFTEMFGNQLKADNYDGKRNILINWGTSNNYIFGKTELAVEEELVIVIRLLILKGYTVTVYPIWTEDINAVKQLVQKVNDKRCQVITVVYEAKVLQKIISQSYLSINLKLHANILSAAANRPFISLAYRGKCFDFAKTVDCLEYTISTDQVTSQKILEMVKDIESNYDDIVKRFKVSKRKYYPRLVNSIYAISDILNKQPLKKVDTASNILLDNVQSNI